MDDEFNQSLRRLAEIVDELIDTAESDFAARYALTMERDALRDRLAEMRGNVDRDTGRATDDLIREVKALEGSAAALRGQMIDPVKQAGGGSHAGEMGNLGATALNSRISEATGLAAMEQRLERLRSILDDRDADTGDGSAPPPTSCREDDLAPTIVPWGTLTQ